MGTKLFSAYDDASINFYWPSPGYDWAAPRTHRLSTDVPVKKACPGCEIDKQKLMAISLELVKKQAEQIEDYINRGLIKPRDLECLIEQGLSIASVQYWREHYQKKAVTSNGMTCSKCQQYNPYATANQPDDSFICYGCRT